MSEIKIRIAVPEDAGVLLKIYAPYVENTAVSFEYAVPSVEEFSHRIRNTLKSYPYLAAEMDGETVGYAYAHTFIPRAAYNWSAESSIYVRMDRKGCGIGKKLYQTLETYLKRQHIQNLNACIASIDVEDETLTNDSERFHRHMGYEMVGKVHHCAYKFNQWYDMIWMEKKLGEYPEQPGRVIPFAELMQADAEE